jgi:predicted CXXCH cytochrome family protein
VRLAPLLLALALPVPALAAGGHDGVGCAGCHSTHAARGAAVFALAPNTKLLDPRTGRPNEPISALCLSCHAERESGGRGVIPVSGHFGHPFSVAKPNPKLARVPPDLLRGGRLECVGCHDPHPSNPNYRYLRIAVTRTPTLTELCSVCHPRKADPSTRAPPLFSSDERPARPEPPAP